jgi:hypothetical protein
VLLVVRFFYFPDLKDIIASSASFNMAATATLGFFDIQKPTAVTSPPATHQKPPKKTPTTIELDQLRFGKRYNGPSETGTPVVHPSGTQSPVEPAAPMTPNELEMSRPPTPKQDEAVGMMQSWNSPPINRWRLLSCCFMYFVNGINDSGEWLPSGSRHCTVSDRMQQLVR